MGLLTKPSLQGLEDVRSYRAFERALIGSVDPRSVIELALVHRLASLLWRLRRASAIETGLFEIQDELLPRAPAGPLPRTRPAGTTANPHQANGQTKPPVRTDETIAPVSDQEPLSTSMRPPLGPWSKSRAIAQCFLRLSHLDPTLLDRVGSYEARLWRQAAQTIWTLEAMRQPPPAQRGGRFASPWCSLIGMPSARE